MNPAITDEILKKANIGIWTIEIDDGAPPRMYADEGMKILLGIKGELSPEDTYSAWYNNIHPDHYSAVKDGVDKMIEGIHAEIQYPWFHPDTGVMYVRCGGVRDFTYTKGLRIQGCHQNVTELIHFQQVAADAEEKERQEREILVKLASIYYSVHLFDIDKNTYVKFNTSETLKEYGIKNEGVDIQTLLNGAMVQFVDKPHLQMMLKFVNLSTLSERMNGKKIVSTEAITVKTGWKRFGFIKVSEDAQGKLKRVILAVQDINHEKMKEENLILLSTTDEVTGLYNRRAYEYAMTEIKSNGMSEGLAIISVDLNGLKTTNDKYGHTAGDELILGAAQCIYDAVNEYGNVYRVGGDEFIAIVNCPEDELESINARIDENANNWQGTYIDKLSVSKGSASLYEFPDYDAEQLEELADKRMYDDKSLYYARTGIDRRRH